MKNDLFRAHFDSYRSLTKHIEDRETGVQLIEMLPFHALSSHYNIDFIVESGVGPGVSTDIIKTLGVTHHAVDNFIWNRELVEGTFGRVCGVEFHDGDSMDVVPNLLRENFYRNCAILIDGPKRIDAYKLAIECIRYCKFIAVHDIDDSVGAFELDDLLARYAYNHGLVYFTTKELDDYYFRQLETENNTVMGYLINV